MNNIIPNEEKIKLYGIKKNFYLYDGQLYTSTFPYEWAKNHIQGSGPKECKECTEFGHWNGVFVAYCRSCATNVYKGERGGGLVYYAGEGECADVNDPKSAGNTYLKNIHLKYIGDKDFHNSFGIYGQLFITIKRNPYELIIPGMFKKWKNCLRFIEMWYEFNDWNIENENFLDEISFEEWIYFYRKRLIECTGDYYYYEMIKY